jgi:hypothetical protein
MPARRADFPGVAGRQLISAALECLETTHPDPLIHPVPGQQQMTDATGDSITVWIESDQLGCSLRSVARKLEPIGRAWLGALEV